MNFQKSLTIDRPVVSAWKNVWDNVEKSVFAKVHPSKIKKQQRYLDVSSPTFFLQWSVVQACGKSKLMILTYIWHGNVLHMCTFRAHSYMPYRRTHVSQAFYTLKSSMDILVIFLSIHCYQNTPNWWCTYSRPLKSRWTYKINIILAYITYTCSKRLLKKALYKWRRETD